MKSLVSLLTICFGLLLSFDGSSQFSNGLVGEFLFNSTLSDSSPLGINGTGTSISSTTGQDGIADGGYIFSGSPSSIDLGSNNRNITTEVTVAAYIKTTSTSYEIFVSDYLYTEDKGYLLSMNNANSSFPGLVSISGRADVGTYRTSGFSTTSVNDGQWHCIVGVVTNNTWLIYVDGVLESSNTYPTNNVNIASSNRNTFIGHINSSGALYYNGEIDDVRLWNRGLTAWEVQNLCGCTIPITFPVAQYELCAPGPEIITTSTTADSLYWVNTNTSGASTTVNYPMAGWYVVQAFNYGSCTGVDSILVSWTTLPTNNLIIEGGATICEHIGQWTTGTTANGDSYLWNDGVTTAQRTFHYPDAGWFYLTVQFGNCSLTDSVLISWIDNAEIDLGPDFSICSGESATLNATSSGGTPLWFDGVSATSTTINSPGTYYATVTNQCGSATDTVVVGLATSGCSTGSSGGSGTPQDTIPAIYLPTAFTPNGDGLNDGFGVQTEMAFGYFKMTIQDRIGNRVFEGYSKDAHWNGTYQNNGEPVPLGTYIYRIEYITLNQGKSGSLYGYVTVLY